MSATQNPPQPGPPAGSPPGAQTLAAPRTPPPLFGPPRPMGGLGVPTQKAKDFKGTVSRLLGYLRPHHAALIVVVIAGVIGTVFMVLGPKILGLATTKIFEGFVA